MQTLHHQLAALRKPFRFPHSCTHRPSLLCGYFSVFSTWMLTLYKRGHVGGMVSKYRTEQHSHSILTVHLTPTWYKRWHFNDNGTYTRETCLVPLGWDSGACLSVRDTSENPQNVFYSRQCHNKLFHHILNVHVLETSKQIMVHEVPIFCVAIFIQVIFSFGLTDRGEI